MSGLVWLEAIDGTLIGLHAVAKVGVCQAPRAQYADQSVAAQVAAAAEPTWCVYVEWVNGGSGAVSAARSREWADEVLVGIKAGLVAAAKYRDGMIVSVAAAQGEATAAVS
ncbi:MAG TPA: hypothetical protein VMX12_00095 [Acidimicrobiia bacterium]|nr:hypothetical protein [Acidimicrobiia bacterium]